MSRNTSCISNAGLHLGMGPGNGSDAQEIPMSKRPIAAIAAALTGCAAIRTMQELDFASGHWTGEIDHGGAVQPLSFDIARDNGAYRGQLRSVSGAPGRALENLEVQGDQVRFETDELRFVGRVTGRTLAGPVTQKPSGAPFGEFSVITYARDYSPSSEWSPPFLP
jgi:hypothetical protein